MNIWGGRGAMSQASLDFVTRDRLISESIEQTVFGHCQRRLLRFFSLPAGPIGFAVGLEYREEDCTGF